MAAATAKYYFPFRICWCHCLQKVKVYEQTKLCRHISIGGWDLITSVFEKQTSAILEFYFRFWSRPLPIICMSFCITLPNFVQIGAPIAEIWRHFHFSRWRPRPLNTSSGFVFVDVTVFRRSKSQKTKFRRHISIGGWDITTSVFEIQTSAILEIYFWFRSQPVRRNLHVIMHQATEFRPNRSTHSATAKYYFRFYICWCHCLQKVKVYQQTKFRQGSSIGGWDITTSGFDPDHFVIIGVSFCTRLPNFVQIGTSAAEIWRYISIFKMAAVSHVVFALGLWRTTHEVLFMVRIPTSNR